MPVACAQILTLCVLPPPLGPSLSWPVIRSAPSQHVPAPVSDPGGGGGAGPQTPPPAKGLGLGVGTADTGQPGSHLLALLGKCAWGSLPQTLQGGWRLCAHRLIWLGARILGSPCSEQPLGASPVCSLRSHRRLLPGSPGGVCGPRLTCHPFPVVRPALRGGWGWVHPADPLTVARGRGSAWCWGSVPWSHPRSLGHQAGGDPPEQGALDTLAALIPPTRLPSFLSG